MVEQAVQTVPAEQAEQKGLSGAQQQGGEMGRAQRPRAPAQRAAQQGAVTGPSPANDENKPPASRRKQGARRSRNRGRGQILVGNTKPSTLQFDSDFDFEKANAQFKKDDLEKEIEDQLGVQEPKKSPEERSDTVLESESTAEEDPLGPKCFYNKAKCFFDNVSSELKSRRTTWAEERKLNVETFGVPGRFLRGRGFRGNYRGRWGRGAAQHPVPQRVGSGRL